MAAAQQRLYTQQQATAAAVAEAVGLHQKSSSVKIENLKTERREGNPLVAGGGSNQAETTVNGMLDDEDRSDGKVRHIFKHYFVKMSSVCGKYERYFTDLLQKGHSITHSGL